MEDGLTFVRSRPAVLEAVRRADGAELLYQQVGVDVVVGARGDVQMGARQQLRNVADVVGARALA